MPKIRPEQIASYGISDLQIAVNAAIKQSKIADQISDPQGWISKGTINIVDSFIGSTAGFQEFGMSINGANDSGLAENTVYYFEVNGKEYSIDTTGQASPISYDEVSSLMENEISADSLSATITNNDLRIVSTTSGYDANVSINENCTRHRLHEYLVGFTGFNEPLKGTGIVWDGSQAGRMFFAKDTNEIFMGVSTDPYYQPFGGSGDGVESTVETISGSQGQDWNGTTATTFRTTNEFQPDGSDLFVYLNGALLEYNSNGTADYQTMTGAGLEGMHTDIVLNSSFVLSAVDKITAIIYISSEVSMYATKAYVNNKLSNGVELSGDTIIDGNVYPNSSGLYDLGTEDNTWNSIYLEDSIYFKPIGTNDNLRIYKNMSGEDTQLRFQIGNSATDKFIFEDENNAEIMSIDGNGNVAIPGNLSISGTTTTINSTETSISDSSFIISTNESPIDGDASFEVERANGNSKLIWNDSIDRWQLTYGSTANITSDILTQDDLTSGKNLDGRYVNQTQIVAAGSLENDGALKYGGIINDGGTLTPGIFYSGTAMPANTNRLNYDGHLYVTALTADDVYVSAQSLYVNGKKVIEDDNDVMTFRADIDQDMQIKTTGTEGDLDFISVDNITSTADGNIDLGISGLKTGKNISLTNQSAAGEIQILATGNGGMIQVQSGGTSADVVNITTDSSEPSGTGRFNIDGYLYATRVYNAIYNDLAEFMPHVEKSEAGMVLIQTDDGLKPCFKRASKAVVGVNSDSFGYALGADDKDNKTPVGLTGRVWVKIKEPVEIGDMFITSNEKGFATVATEQELLIPGIKFGKALKTKTDSLEERVPMLIMNC